MSIEDKIDPVTDTPDEYIGVDLDSMQIGPLRKYAALYKVPLEKTMTRDEILAAIKHKMRKTELAVIAEKGTRPRPGFARVELHKDPSHLAANLPVYFQRQGGTFTIPRGVEVDIPLNLVEVIRNTKSRRPVQKTHEHTGQTYFAHEDVPTYSFSLVDANYDAVSPVTDFEKAKRARQGPRKAFNTLFGRWPKGNELMEAVKEGFITLKPEEREHIS